MHSKSKGRTLLQNMAIIAALATIVSIGATYLWKQTDSYKEQTAQAEAAKNKTAQPAANKK